ncbi:MAG: PPC domain-containing protein [Terricaulis sp.]
MKTRLLVGVAALLGTFGVAEQAHAESCNDMVKRARGIRTQFEGGATPQQAALSELRTLRLQANGCEANPQNAIDGIIQRVAGAAPPTPTAPVANPSTPVVTPPVTPPPVVVARSAAPRRLTVGQSVTSALSAETAVDSEGVAFERWTVRAQAGQALQVSMAESSDSGLDTYIVLGRMQGGEFVEIDRNDDSGGTFNSMLRFTPDATGDYEIRARSFGSGQFGAYDLVVSPYVAPAPAVSRPIAIDEVSNGSLTAESPADDNGVAYDVWTFEAQAGQRLQIAMSARNDSNLDTYLLLGRMVDGEFQQIDSNDDRGDGTFNSLLRFYPAEDGEYTIRARSFGQGQYGDYELAVQSTPFVVGAMERIARNANAWMRPGALTAEADHVDFEFQAARGKSYSVRAISNDFRPVVDVGFLGREGATEVDYYDGPSSERESNAVEFRADNRGRYVVRVSASALATGSFDLIVSELP